MTRNESIVSLESGQDRQAPLECGGWKRSTPERRSQRGQWKKIFNIWVLMELEKDADFTLGENFKEAF